MECIFCQIIKKEIPCQKLYEDEHVISFLDIFPGARGHSLIVPKTHYANLEAAPPQVLNQLMQASQKVSIALVNTLGAEGFNILLNNAEVAGQKVPHLHFHILPRYSKDGLHLDLQHYIYKEQEIEKIREKVAVAIEDITHQQLISAIQTAAADNKLNCAQALQLAREHQVPSKELGDLLNQLNIKLRNCQLGCF